MLYVCSALEPFSRASVSRDKMKMQTYIIVDHNNGDAKVAGPFRTPKDASKERDRLESIAEDKGSSEIFWIVPTPVNIVKL